MSDLRKAALDELARLSQELGLYTENEDIESYEMSPAVQSAVAARDDFLVAWRAFGLAIHSICARMALSLYEPVRADAIWEAFLDMPSRGMFEALEEWIQAVGENQSSREE